MQAAVVVAISPEVSPVSTQVRQLGDKPSTKMPQRVVMQVSVRSIAHEVCTQVNIGVNSSMVQANAIAASGVVAGASGITTAGASITMGAASGAASIGAAELSPHANATKASTQHAMVFMARNLAGDSASVPIYVPILCVIALHGLSSGVLLDSHRENWRNVSAQLAVLRQAGTPT